MDDYERLGRIQVAMSELLTAFDEIVSQITGSDIDYDDDQDLAVITIENPRARRYRDLLGRIRKEIDA